MKALKLTDDEYYFLSSALKILRHIMESASALQVCYRPPDQHYDRPLRRIIDKLADLNKQKTS